MLVSGTFCDRFQKQFWYVLGSTLGAFGGTESRQNDILYVWGATAAPNGDRQIQIQGMLFLEAAETANQQTIQKLTPKTIKNANKLKQQRSKEFQMSSKIAFF